MIIAFFLFQDGDKGEEVKSDITGNDREQVVNKGGWGLKKKQRGEGSGGVNGYI